MSVNLPDERRTHILDGDEHGGGGHRHGTGRPLKTEFPERWSDDRIIAHVLSVAQSPDDTPFMQDNGRWKVHGVRDGVDVSVIVKPDGRIWTSYPEPGGEGVVENPEA